MVLILFIGFFVLGAILWRGAERLRNGRSFRKRPETLVVQGMTLLMGAAVLAYGVYDAAWNSLCINEVGVSGYWDESGEYHAQDYVELFNGSILPLSLDGLGLSRQEDGRRTLMTEHMILPGGHLLIDDLTFDIGETEKSLCLTNAKGKTLDEVEIPLLEFGSCYARFKDGRKEWMVQLSTPGEKNDPDRYPLAPPSFSAPGGFYEDGFDLELSAPEGITIRYTMDSQNPLTNGYRYQEPIPIRNVSNSPNIYREVQNVIEDWQSYSPSTVRVDKMQVIRAVAMDDKGNTSPVVTQSYLVNMDAYRKNLVVSLVSDPELLFGEDGIYVTGREYDQWLEGGQQGEKPEANYFKTGKEWEIPANLEIYSAEEQMAAQPVGVRIQGAGSRKQPDKRFSVYARKEYSGSRYFPVNFFGTDREQLHSFALRESQADSIAAALFRDKASQTTLNYVSADLFLNGEFWYHTYLREKGDENLLSQRYGIPRDKIEIFDAVPQDVYEGLAQKTYEDLCAEMDMQSYIDNLAANVYMGNTDQNEEHNMRMWRVTTPDPDRDDPLWDGRLRCFLYDIDALIWNDETHETFRFIQEKHPLYLHLKAMPQFRQRFVTSFMDLVNDTFSVGNVERAMEDFNAGVNWNHDYFLYRGDYIVPQLAEEFELTGSLVFVTLETNDPAAGTLMLNSLTPSLDADSWSGIYYTDFPAELTACAKRGYRFAGWMVNGELVSQEECIQIPLNENTTIEGIFEKE